MPCLVPASNGVPVIFCSQANKQRMRRSAETPLRRFEKVRRILQWPACFGI
jgi:hypothetical protein